ncbi:MAG: glycosyltransferase family 39 protein [Alphaproteobacteria bacterium]|nr:glycosyltransferase family 39 protein [Alphaproteobacteria bacterium]
MTLALRCLFVFQWSQTPYATMPLLDAKVYHDWALTIASGELLRGKAFYQSPLFPYMLGLIYAFLGQSFILVGILNAVLEAATATMLAFMSLTAFGSIGAALATGLLAAFYRPTIFYTAPLMKEPLGLFLLTVFFLIFQKGLETNRARSFFLSGCLLGLAALVRGNFLCLAPSALIVGTYYWRRVFLKSGVLFALGVMLAVSPATLHNYLVCDDFVLINYTDGFNLYIGNSPTANGTNSYPPEVSTDPVQEEMNTIWVATKKEGHSLSPSEVSHFWRDQALAYMVENPARIVELIFNKFLAFWNGHEQFDNYDISFIEKNFDTLLSWPLVPFWVVSSLSAVGAVLLSRRRRKQVFLYVLFAAAYMGTLMLFYVTDRYRLPVIVFLLPLAGAAFAALYDGVRDKACKPLVMALLAGGFFLFLGLRPPLDPVDLTAFNWGTLSMVYSDLEQDQKAIAAFDKAVSYSPIQAGASAYARASYAYEHMGNEKSAQEVLEQAIKVFPDNGILLYNYARFKAARNQLSEALQLFERALQLSPFYLLNYYALAKGYTLVGQRDRARYFVKVGLDLDPSDPLLNQVMAEIDGREGVIK